MIKNKLLLFIHSYCLKFRQQTLSYAYYKIAAIIRLNLEKNIKEISHRNTNPYKNTAFKKCLL